MNTPTQTPPSPSTNTLNIPKPDIRTVSGISIVATNVLLWVFKTYVFRAAVPSDVTVALYAVVPAVVGVVFTHLALNKMPPSYLEALRQRWAKSMRDPMIHIADIPPNTVQLDLPSMGTVTSGNIQVTGPDGFPPITAENPTVDDNPAGGAL